MIPSLAVRLDMSGPNGNVLLPGKNLKKYFFSIRYYNAFP